MQGRRPGTALSSAFTWLRRAGRWRKGRIRASPPAGHSPYTHTPATAALAWSQKCERLLVLRGDCLDPGSACGPARRGRGRGGGGAGWGGASTAFPGALFLAERCQSALSRPRELHAVRDWSAGWTSGPTPNRQTYRGRRAPRQIRIQKRADLARWNLVALRRLPPVQASSCRCIQSDRCLAVSARLRTMKLLPSVMLKLFLAAGKRAADVSEVGSGVGAPCGGHVGRSMSCLPPPPLVDHLVGPVRPRERAWTSMAWWRGV